MADLLCAFGSLIVVSVAVFAGAGWWASRLPARAALIAAVIILLALLAFLSCLRDHLILARLLPVTGVLVAGDFSLPLMAALAAVVATQIRSSPARRCLIGGVLLALGCVAVLRPLLGASPEIAESSRWQNGVCLQTSESSCSAASAATLLAARGLPAGESEMARLCLTREPGTSMLGVYRGLRRKTDGTPWRVAVLACATVDDLRRALRQGPVLLSVGLDRFQPLPDQRYVTEWGWSRGSYHAVVLFGFLPNGDLDIGDPAVGREKWHADSLNVLWHGEGLQLAPIAS